MAADRETRIPDADGAGLLNDPSMQDLISGDPRLVAGDDISDTLAAVEYVLRFFGGTVQVAAVRLPIAPDVAPEAHVTVEYVVRWNPYDLKRPVADMPQGEAVERAQDLTAVAEEQAA